MGPIVINVAHYWVNHYLAAAKLALLASRYYDVGSYNFNELRALWAKFLVHSDHYRHVRLQHLRRYAH